MSKRERDLKRKLQEEQQAAAYVYQEFIDTFHNPSSVKKTFVKCGTLFADKEENDNVGKIYNPKPLKQQKIDTKSTAIECARILQDPVLDKPTKKQGKPKSNLDLLKEELKQRHSERGEKERLKEEYDWDVPLNCYSEGGDPNTTNLFVANLPSTVTENHLMLEFGAYGPLASVKIMWPKAGDEKSRMSNCGFVAFMSRKDAERALKENQHRTDLRLGWAKRVELPAHPVHVPAELLQLHLPPPRTDLPFGALPPTPRPPEPLPVSTVRVVVPLDKKRLALIHRVVEFVVREGPVFEAFLMRRELANPEFGFLFDNKSPQHVYYRWKLFSVLNGDGQREWSREKFRMFVGGSVWVPPAPLRFADGMPEELARGGRLGEARRAQLVQLLRGLTPSRRDVGEAMVFCLTHRAALDDSLEVVLDALANPPTAPEKKAARLYLLSDVLHNSRRLGLKTRLEEEPEALLGVFRGFGGGRGFRKRVLRVVKQWRSAGMFSEGFIERVEGVLAPVEYFVPSKWDAVEAEEVEARAVSMEAEGRMRRS